MMNMFLALKGLTVVMTAVVTVLMILLLIYDNDRCNGHVILSPKPKHERRSHKETPPTP